MTGCAPLVRPVTGMVMISRTELITVMIPTYRSLQFAGQSTFTALGKAKQAVFFSLLRKAIIVIPLTLWLPTVGGLGTNGVFLAEPASNFIGGTACFVTMIFTVWRKLDSGKQK